MDPVFIQSSPSVPAPSFSVGRPLENMHGLIVFYERYVLTALGRPPSSFLLLLSEEIFYEASFSLLTVMLCQHF